MKVMCGYLLVTAGAKEQWRCVMTGYGVLFVMMHLAMQKLKLSVQCWVMILKVICMLLVLYIDLMFSNFVGAQAFSGAYFGERYGPIILDDLGCTGNEKSIFNCSGSSIGVHDCTHGEDAGVRCPCKKIHIITILY